MSDTRKPAALQGEVFFTDQAQRTLAAEQVKLLQAIEECGAISRAAKAVGISYKTAWDRIDAMNNMADQPLVERSAGGARGGGTQLTDYGKQIVRGFNALQAEHEQFLKRLGTRLTSFKDVAHFVKTSCLNTSARNQFYGMIEQVTPGAVNAEVILRISPQQHLVVMVTEQSRQRLALQTGMPVFALIKASAIILSTGLSLATTADNRLIGRIAHITRGAVNSDVVIDLEAGKSLGAIVSNASVEQLGLSEGQQVSSLFDASSVILIVD